MEAFKAFRGSIKGCRLTSACQRNGFPLYPCPASGHAGGGKTGRAPVQVTTIKRCTVLDHAALAKRPGTTGAPFEDTD